MAYCVYILTNKNHTVLYTGVTNNIHRRVQEHKGGRGSKFTRKYNADKLIYIELKCNDRKFSKFWLLPSIDPN